MTKILLFHFHLPATPGRKDTLSDEAAPPVLIRQPENRSFSGLVWFGLVCLGIYLTL